MSATVTLTKPRKKRSLPIKANGVLKKEEVEEPTTTTAKVQSKADKADKAAKSQIDYYDSSDEEDLRNTIGNIPVQWYDDLNHIGYDLEGEKIAKPAKKDQIDIFLQKMEDPDYWRKVMDKQTGTEITLSEEQIEQIHSLSSGKCPTIGYNPYQPFLDIYSQDTTIHPVDNVPASKQSFIPSKDEMRKVAKLVDAIRRGWLKPRKPKEKATKTYDLWADESEEARQKTKSEMARIRMHFPAPKVTLPGNVESYNPPEEYLLDDDEKKKWEEEEPEDRPMNYQPTKFDSMRRVPSYDNFVRERFERCLDLYLAPRQRKMRLEVKDHTDLLPDLPNPADLKPFPTTLAFFMTGHRGQVRALSFEPSGTELLASGGEDGDVRIWSVASGRCVKVHSLGSPITSMAYCPSKDKCILAVAVEGKKVILLNAESGDRLQVSSTATFIAGLPVGEHDSKIVWKRTDKAHGRLTLDMPSEIRQVVWHAKGDYFATVGTVDSADAVFIHQLSKAKSQMPFSKRKGQVRAVSFAVTVPHLFVATQRHVRVYDLGRCNLVKKLQCNMQAISTIQADNAGENLFVGGLDRRMSWMDLQMGTKPWKTLRHHASAIRGIAYHRRLPLLCTAGDDGQAIVYHARIYTDVFRESEIVPVKRLGAHEKIDDKVILACEWHPTRAWLATGGADGKIAFFSH